MCIEERRVRRGEKRGERRGGEEGSGEGDEGSGEGEGQPCPISSGVIVSLFIMFDHITVKVLCFSTSIKGGGSCAFHRCIRRSSIHVQSKLGLHQSIYSCVY